MTEEEKGCCKDCFEKMASKHCHHGHGRYGGDSSILYCLGVVGSLFYFL